MGNGWRQLGVSAAASVVALVEKSLKVVSLCAEYYYPRQEYQKKDADLSKVGPQVIPQPPCIPKRPISLLYILRGPREVWSNQSTQPEYFNAIGCVWKLTHLSVFLKIWTSLLPVQEQLDFSKLSQ